jgi:ABC-type maltose transport system permease subunit
MAAGVMMSVPLLILYFVAQRYIVAGLAAGAVKG